MAQAKGATQKKTPAHGLSKKDYALFPCMAHARSATHISWHMAHAKSAVQHARRMAQAKNATDNKWLMQNATQHSWPSPGQWLKHKEALPL